MSQHTDHDLDPLWYSNTAIGVELDEISKHLLAIVGPSGAGKTTLAANLQHRYPEVALVPKIYTTRQRRDDDIHDHYVYVSGAEFDEMVRRGDFFIWRIDPQPRYGWRGSDLLNIVSSGQIAILPLRHDGAKFLVRLIRRMMMVLIEPSLDSPFLYLDHRLKTHKEIDVSSIIIENRILVDAAKSIGCAVSVVSNNYSGQSEMDELANAVMCWIGEFNNSG